MVYKQANIREYRRELEFLLAFRVCTYGMLFSWFLWKLWRKEREAGQTVAGKIVTVALEVALWMCNQGADGAVFIAKRIWKAFIEDILEWVSNEVCARADSIFDSVIDAILFCWFRP